MSNEQEGAKVFKVELGVGKPVRNKIVRKGRGFSRLELKEAGGTVFEAREFDIPVDIKRKSVHEFNISVLKQLLEEERASAVRAKLEKEILEEKYQEFIQVRGIGLSSAKTLVEMDITSIEELAALEADKLETEVPISTLKRWIRNAKKHLGEEIEEEEPEEIKEEELEELEAELEEIEEEEFEELEEAEIEEMEAELDELEDTELEELEVELEEIGAEEELVEIAPEEELTDLEKDEIYKELMQVRGIGKKTAQKIVELGVTSIEELAALEVDKIPETAEITTKTLRTWIKNAQKHLERETKEVKEEETEEITDEELDRIEAELDKLEDLEEEDIDAILLDEDLED